MFPIDEISQICMIVARIAVHYLFMQEHAILHSLHSKN